MAITYKQLDWSHKPEWQKMTEAICAGLENKDIFYPYSEEEYEIMLNKGFVIGAFEGGALIGFNVLLIKEDYCELDGVMVLQEYRRQGLQKKMDEICVNHAKKIGAKKIIVKIHPDNFSNVACEEIGFVRAINPECYMRAID